MNAVAMLTRCWVRQENIRATDGTTESIADTPRFAEEPCVVDIIDLPDAVELRAEAASLGLDV